MEIEKVNALGIRISVLAVHVVPLNRLAVFKFDEGHADD
jgi:hypothetical protein